MTALQKQYKLTPLSAWGRPYTPPAHVPVAAGVDTQTPPLEQVRKMDAGAFFGRLARLMKDNPPAPADAPMVAKLKTLGIEPGQDFDISRMAPHQAKGLERAMGTFTLLEKGVQKLKTANGWIVIPENFANYGTDYETRAGIALVGLGGIQPKDVVYPTAFLDGATRYVLHFDKDQTPPTQATWSIAMYDPQGFYVPNALNRYALAAWMPLQYNSDGSLDLYIQASSPGADQEANWLPAPASGPFNLTVRVYWPTDAVLDGTYKLPPVRKVPGSRCRGEAYSDKRYSASFEGSAEPGLAAHPPQGGSTWALSGERPCAYRWSPSPLCPRRRRWPSRPRASRVAQRHGGLHAQHRHAVLDGAGGSTRRAARAVHAGDRKESLLRRATRRHVHVQLQLHREPHHRQASIFQFLYTDYWRPGTDCHWVSIIGH